MGWGRVRASLGEMEEKMNEQGKLRFWRENELN